MYRRSFLSSLAVGTTLCGGALAAFPETTVHLIVPWAAGGSADLLARLLADNLRQKYGRSVVVENRAGASGNIGSELVAKAKPDGQTLLMGVMSTHVINPLMMSPMPFDGIVDFTPIAAVGVATTALVVHTSVPANTLQEFLAYARSNPKKLAYGTSGEGSPTHLGSALLGKMAGIDMVHIPYKGGGPAMVDLLGGQIQLMLTSANIALPHVKAGKLKLLAVSEPRRAEILPHLPAVNEVIPGYEYSLYLGLFGPRGMAQPLVAQLNADVNSIMTRADVKEKLTVLGIEAVNQGPEALSRILRAERDKWGPLLKDMGLVVK